MGEAKTEDDGLTKNTQPNAHISDFVLTDKSLTTPGAIHLGVPIKPANEVVESDPSSLGSLEVELKPDNMGRPSAAITIFAWRRSTINDR